MSRWRELKLLQLQCSTFELFYSRGRFGRYSIYLQLAIGFVILASTALSIWETVPTNSLEDHRFLAFCQDLFGVLFLVEYIARLWIAPIRYPEHSPFRARIKKAFTFSMLVDLLVILPFLMPFAFALDITSLRVFRLLRIMRIARFGRFSKSMAMMGHVIRKSAPELYVTLAIAIILLLVAATGIYHFERDAQPETFSSIPQSIWWALNALTGIYYGDVYPLTLGGKVFAGLVALLGVAIVALPAGIIASGLIEAVAKTKRPAAPKLCPHCSEPIFDLDKSA